MRRTLFQEIRQNKIRSWFIFFLFFLLIAIIGVAFGLWWGDFYFGFGLAAVIGVIYSLIAWYSGDKMILSMSGAKEITKREYPKLVNIVEGLAVAAGIKKGPNVFVIKDSALNAFATGRDPKHAAITVTTGLMDKLNKEELEGVIAHEMSHIKNYDIRMMMLASVLTGVIILLGDFMLRSFLWGGRGRRRSGGGKGAAIGMAVALVLAILAPIIAQLVKLAVSRKREYLADVSGAALTRYPPGLANALAKIKKDPDPLVDRANRATAHLFISTPFRNQRSGSLWSTHPPIDERIKRLRQM